MNSHGNVVHAHHPMLAGHFPGNPIVPGAWLLAWIIAVAGQQLAAAKVARAIAGVKRVKFQRPLAPEQMFECALKMGADTLRFTVTSGEVVIADGALLLQNIDE